MPPSKDMPNILRVPGDYEVTKVVHSDTYPEINGHDVGIDLTGMAVFITGGSRGLGRAMALSFARAGASHIAVGARSAQAALSSLAADMAQAAAETERRPPPQLLTVTMDVTDEASVSAAAAEVEAKFGQLHVLINNAGILGQYGLIADSDPRAWKQVVDVNLYGPYLATRAFLPLLLKSSTSNRTGKYIINVTSGGAHLTNPTLSAYQVSKNALLKLSTLTQAEYASAGITTIAIHPGNSPTDIMGGPQAIPPHHKHVFVDTPALSGDSIVYLVSRDSSWLGGRYVNCTWDLPELMSKREEIVQADKLKTKFDY